MFQSQSSLFNNGASLITNKQKQFIQQTLIKTDETLSQLRKNHTRQKSKTLQNGLSQSNILEKTSLQFIDKHYTLLLKCIQIKVKKPYHIFLQPHTQQYFVFDMGLFVFPITLQINKISFQGILFIGFNQQYPGIIKNHNFDPLSQKKINLNKVQNIQIHQPGNRNVHRIYFLFTSLKKSLTVNFKLKTFQKKQSQQQIIPKKKKNFLQIIDQKLKAPVPKLRVKTQLSPKFSMTKASYLQKLQKISNDDHFTTFTSKFSLKKEQKINNKNFDELKNFSRQLFFDNKYQKSTSEQNIQQSSSFLKTQYNNRTIGSFLRSHISFSNEQKHMISQKNLKQLDLYRQKKQKLNYLVQKFKKQIQILKKQNDERSLKQKKIVKHVTILLQLYKFIKISQIRFLKRKKYLDSCLKTLVYVNKFVRKIKNKRQLSINMVPKNIPRIVYGLLPASKFLASIFYEAAEDKADKVISKSINKLFPSLISRNLLQKSTLYLKKIIHIQQMYRQRFTCQKQMLRIYCFQIKIKLTTKFPHFNKFSQKFNEQKIYQNLISTYLKDQNLKFNQRIMVYYKQLKEREEFIQMKSNLMKKNKKQESSKVRRKSLNKSFKKQESINLQIPQIPQKPCRNLFKNLNILETMIRNWFELQNFMWKKKQKAKNWY